jgi:hypothetical protein
MERDLKITGILVLAVLILLAGCTAPAPQTGPGPTPAITSTTGPGITEAVSEQTPAITSTAGPGITGTVVTPTQDVQTVAATEITPEETTGSSTEEEIYYGTLVIPMDREQYQVINFEDIGYTYLNNGEKYIVRFTSDHAIFAYVIRTEDVPRLDTDLGIPVYDSIRRTYDYNNLHPVMKIENRFEDGSDFTVKDFGKYSLVLDCRLSPRDYRIDNEVATVTVRILKVG